METYQKEGTHDIAKYFEQKCHAEILKYYEQRRKELDELNPRDFDQIKKEIEYYSLWRLVRCPECDYLNMLNARVHDEAYCSVCGYEMDTDDIFGEDSCETPTPILQLTMEKVEDSIEPSLREFLKNT